MYSSDEVGGICGHFIVTQPPKAEGRKIEFSILIFCVILKTRSKYYFLTFEMQEILTIRHANYKLLLNFITILITMLNKQFL